MKLRFSDEEKELLDAFVKYTGEQPATLIRELVMRELLGTFDIKQGK